MLLLRARYAFARRYHDSRRYPHDHTHVHGTTTLRGTIYTLGSAHPDAAGQLDRLMRDPRASWSMSAPNPDRVPGPVEPCRAHGPLRSPLRVGPPARQHPLPDRSGVSQLAEGHPDAIREAATLLCEGTSLILLCACTNARNCHRNLVARLIQDALPVPKHREVQHNNKK